MGIISHDKSIPPEEALFSQAQRQVLALLFTHPDRSFYTNEIIHLTNSGSGAIQRELKKLASSELITIQKIGNQKRYQANHTSPIFSEIRNIVIKTFGLADCIRNALTSVAKQIHVAFIYGSIARGDATAKSDIDLMLITDKLSYADVFPLLENTNTQLQRTVNPSIYSLIEWKDKVKSGNHFLIKVLQQPKIFLIGNEHELRSIE